MGQFMNHGEGLRTFGIICVYRDERSDVICQSKPAKQIDRYLGVVAAKIVHKEDEYPGGFNLGSQIGDRITDCTAAPVSTEVELDCFSDPARQNARLRGCACRSDEKQCFSFILFFKGRTHQGLSGADVTDDGIDQSVVGHCKSCR